VTVKQPKPWNTPLRSFAKNEISAAKTQTSKHQEKLEVGGARASIWKQLTATLRMSLACFSRFESPGLGTPDSKTVATCRPRSENESENGSGAKMVNKMLAM
jgi:hypothetical protein